MDTDKIRQKTASNWQPMTNKHDLAVLGKLGEEAGELSAAISRCIIQGLNEKHPSTGKSNRLWLEEELADAQALISLAIARLGLDQAAIEDRRLAKFDYAHPWLKGLAETP